MGDAFEDGDKRDRPPESDRRSGPDRRGWLDRRGSGARSPMSKESRPYAFRSFDEPRRSMQDRRLYGAEDGPWDGRRDDDNGDRRDGGDRTA